METISVPSERINVENASKKGYGQRYTPNLHKRWQQVKRHTSKFQKCAKVSANLSGATHSKSLRCSKHDVFAATQTFGAVWITEFSGKLCTNLEFVFHFWKQY